MSFGSDGGQIPNFKKMFEETMGAEAAANLHKAIASADPQILFIVLYTLGLKDCSFGDLLIEVVRALTHSDHHPLAQAIKEAAKQAEEKGGK